MGRRTDDELRRVDGAQGQWPASPRPSGWSSGACLPAGWLAPGRGSVSDRSRGVARIIAVRALSVLVRLDRVPPRAIGDLAVVEPDCR